MSVQVPLALLDLPSELLVTIFSHLDAREVLALRLTSSRLNRLSHDDVAIWRPLFMKRFPASTSRPATQRPRRSGRGAVIILRSRFAEAQTQGHAVDGLEPLLAIPREAHTSLLVPRFQRSWEWALKSKSLDLLVLTRRGTTCYASPKVRFPPERWVAHCEEKYGFWYYEGEWRSKDGDGYGACVFKNGNYYCGQWKDDMMHGEGVMRYRDGSVYDGSWCRNARYGAKPDHAAWLTNYLIQ